MIAATPASAHWVRGRPAGIESEAGRWARVSRGRRRHLLRTVGWLIREWRRELPRTEGWLSRERWRQLPRTPGSLSRERRRELPRTAGWLSRGENSRERRRKRRLLFGSGLLSRCTQQGETRNTQTRIYFKIIVFNDDIKVRQGNADTQKHRE